MGQKRNVNKPDAKLKPAPQDFQVNVGTASRKEGQTSGQLCSVTLPRIFWEMLLADNVASAMLMDKSSNPNGILYRKIAGMIQEQTDIDMRMS